MSYTRPIVNTFNIVSIQFTDDFLFICQSRFIYIFVALCYFKNVWQPVCISLTYWHFNLLNWNYWATWHSTLQNCLLKCPSFQSQIPCFQGQFFCSDTWNLKIFFSEFTWLMELLTLFQYSWHNLHKLSWSFIWCFQTRMNLLVLFLYASI